MGTESFQACFRNIMKWPFSSCEMVWGLTLHILEDAQGDPGPNPRAGLVAGDG